MPGSKKKVQIDSNPQMNTGMKTPRSRRKKKAKKLENINKISTPVSSAPPSDDEDEEEKGYPPPETPRKPLK